MRTEKGQFYLILVNLYSVLVLESKPSQDLYYNLLFWLASSNGPLLFSAIVVSIYEEPTTPQQAANVVEKLGEYLMGHGY